MTWGSFKVQGSYFSSELKVPKSYKNIQRLATTLYRVSDIFHLVVIMQAVDFVNN